MSDATTPTPHATSAADAEAARDADPLRLTHCPDCEYALAGLPAEGTCPECGRAYGGDDLIALNGDGFGRWAGRSYLAVSIQAGCGAILLTNPTAQVTGSHWIGGGLVAFAAITLGLRQLTPDGGTVQVRMSSAGCLQRERGREDPAVRLLQLASHLVYVVMCTGWMISGWKLSGWVSVGLMLVFILAVLLGQFRMGWRAWRRVLAQPGGTELLPAHDWLWPATVAAWADVQDVSIRGPSAGDPRTTIDVRGPQWWLFGGAQVAAAVVRCTPAEAAALRARVTAWREFARNRGKAVD